MLLDIPPLDRATVDPITNLADFLDAQGCTHIAEWKEIGLLVAIHPDTGSQFAVPYMAALGDVLDKMAEHRAQFERKAP